MRTCGWERMFSQMRGGANVMVGPISRKSWRTVEASSGQLTVQPERKATASEKKLSPIQAIGREAMTVSRPSSGSGATEVLPVVPRAPRGAPTAVGKPVFPDGEGV